MRGNLPNATFFTTDLDARMNDPETYPWMRNLIVGSSYGFFVVSVCVVIISVGSHAQGTLDTAEEFHLPKRVTHPTIPKGIHSGAFVPWTRHPILQSIALPSGGIGLLSLLNSFL